MMNGFREVVELAIKKQLQEVEDELVKEYTAKFRNKVGQIIAGLTTELHQQMSFERFNDRLVIKVNFKEKL
jgi:hypothetical protein